MTEALLWIGFLVFITGMLILDLKVLQKKEHEIQIREALLWTLFWIVLSLLFNVGIYFYMGVDYALEFLTGYLIEKALSVDNIFVFIIIFTYFSVPPRYQHKILFWGILGAVIMRGVFIFAGVAIIQRLHWVIYILGAFLVYIGIKMAFAKEKKIHPEKNPILRTFNKLYPVDYDYKGNKFFTKKAGRLVATPLFVVLIVIETTDIMFAVDSIPAILSITLHPFIVFTSNIFAILGLRALYFAVSGIMKLFKFLNYGLSIILVFVGVKMLISDYYKIPVSIALSVVGGILAVSIILSLVVTRREKKRNEKNKN
jgi:tellurite resistance protein TerC